MGSRHISLYHAVRGCARPESEREIPSFGPDDRVIAVTRLKQLIVRQCLHYRKQINIKRCPVLTFALKSRLN